VKLLSFSYKNRDPSKLGVLLTFDLRQLKPNPHNDLVLRNLDGRDPRIQQFVLGGGELQKVLAEAERNVDRHSAIAFGCVGGRHRSVVAVEVLAAHLKAKGIPVVVNHLELAGADGSCSTSPISSASQTPSSTSTPLRSFSTSTSSCRSVPFQSPSGSSCSSVHRNSSILPAATSGIQETKTLSVAFQEKLESEEGRGRGRRSGARFQGRTPAGHFKIERQFSIHGSRVSFCLCRGDITVCPVEAIVNAANLACLGGFGVDGAIHTAAGPALKALCEKLPEIRPGVRCPWGDAKLTSSAGLPAPIRHVIHAVGPIHPASQFWGDKRSKWQIDFAPSHVDKLLRSAYDACFARCSENGIRSIGFPAISCGVFGFPYEAATRIAMESILAHSASATLEKVMLVGLEQPAWDAYNTVCNCLVAQGVLREVALDSVPASVRSNSTNLVTAPAEAFSSSDSQEQPEVVVIHEQAPAGLSQSARRRQRKQKQENAR